MSQELNSFALIGSGRVASHLGSALVDSGLACRGVFSPTYGHAKPLADTLCSPVISELVEMSDLDADFVLIAIKDDAIREVASSFPKDYNGVLLHTSGGTPLSALNGVPHYGVLYPMQTFSHNRTIDISEIPLFYEASDTMTEGIIRSITRALKSKSVHFLSSDNRVFLHIASVFACNFVNHLYAQADEIMHRIDLDFSALIPLVRETLDKAMSYPPKEVQTGPAARGDMQTVDRHLSCLSGHQKELYETITKVILEEYKTKK